MFRWTPEATREQKERVKEELGRLPALIPQVRAFHLGEDLGLAGDINFDFALAPTSTISPGTWPTGKTRSTGRSSRPSSSRSSAPAARSSTRSERYASEGALGQLHQVQRGLLGDLALGGQPGQHGGGEEPARATLPV